MQRDYRTLQIDRPALDKQVNDLCENFDFYLDIFDKRTPFSSEQLRCHRRTIAKGRSLGAVTKSIESDDFLNSLFETLKAWGNGQQGRQIDELL